MQYRSIFDYLSDDRRFDIVLAQLPVPKNDEKFSLGICADFLPAVLDKAGLFVAEFNAQQPLPDDSPAWSASRLDYAVRCDQFVSEIPVADVDAAAADIGRHVADIIQDGDCLQVGIGGIPNAILAELRNKNDLGVHSGLVSDGIMDLAIAGNITGSRKSIDSGRIVTGTTLGSRNLLEWAGSDPSLRFRPVNYTHDAGNIRQLEQFVSINSALQVDLFGQVNSDMLNGKQISGTGGAIDMMRGAAMSKGGRSIIALKATAEGGKTSRIIPRLSADTAATILRTDVDYIVTEFGVRRIRHLSAADRVSALLELAAPQFRNQLRQDWLAGSS
jgi:4-hydroxybutyrate CoA-transferase